jgi:hypothetical protein
MPKSEPITNAEIIFVKFLELLLVSVCIDYLHVRFKLV